MYSRCKLVKLPLPLDNHPSYPPTMPVTAGHPFNEATADIALCSDDDVVFKLHKVILILASDFFKDMLSLPQPSTGDLGSSEDDYYDGLLLIKVSEQSDVLERLFRLCYPVDDPPLETIDVVRATLEAAMKYQMAEAVKITKRRLLALARHEPLRVYAVACCFGLEEEASAAAKEVFKQKAQEGYVGGSRTYPLARIIGFYHIVTVEDESETSSSSLCTVQVAEVRCLPSLLLQQWTRSLLTRPTESLNQESPPLHLMIWRLKSRW